MWFSNIFHPNEIHQTMTSLKIQSVNMLVRKIQTHDILSMNWINSQLFTGLLEKNTEKPSSFPSTKKSNTQFVHPQTPSKMSNRAKLTDLVICFDDRVKSPQPAVVVSLTRCAPLDHCKNSLARDENDQSVKCKKNTQGQWNRTNTDLYGALQKSTSLKKLWSLSWPKVVKESFFAVQQITCFSIGRSTKNPGSCNNVCSPHGFTKTSRDENTRW